MPDDRGWLDRQSDELADYVWDASTRLMDTLAEGAPPGMAEVSEYDQLMILEGAAEIYPWWEWTDADMLGDLYRLKKKLESGNGQELEEIKVFRDRARELAKDAFDPESTE